MKLHMSTSARPLLKWAGGKRQLLPTIRRYYPAQFRRYIEPFFGSGAVFFDLAGSGALDGRDVWLLDVNRDLVDCYHMLRDRTEAVIARLQSLAASHARRGEDFYYEVRDQRFNPARAAGEHRTPELAAMLIYLNRTGFNGLYRLNRRGDFNMLRRASATHRTCARSRPRCGGRSCASSRGRSRRRCTRRRPAISSIAIPRTRR